MTFRKSIGALGAGTIAGICAAVSPVPAQACGADVYLGTICQFGFNFAPRGFALAQGQLLPIAQYSALFSLFGTTYGGDGRTTFALPDLRGRVAVGMGNGPGLSNYVIGAKSGVENVTLNVKQMPSHNHSATTDVTVTSTVNAYNSAGNQDTPSGHIWASENRTDVYSDQAPDVTMTAAAIANASSATTSITNTGGSQPHENRMPYLVINYSVALQGIFPSRN